jgi:sec-independent protein translocase protein TatA
MGSISIWHWLIVLAVVLLFFGNRLPNVMGDLAKGIKNFKAGMKDEDAEEAQRPLPKASADATVDTAKKDEAVH